MTAGAPTRQDVGQIYLMLVQGCLKTAEISSHLSFPASVWEVNSLRQIKEKGVAHTSHLPSAGGMWIPAGVAAPASAGLRLSPEVRRAAVASAAGVGIPWFL